MRKLKRFMMGGLWIHHKDDGWVQGKWSDRVDGLILDERHHGYYHSLISITKIEEYPVWRRQKRCVLCGK